MTPEQLANSFLQEGWVLLPPPGCVVRVKRACYNEPREFHIDEIEIEIDLSFTLWQHGENKIDAYEQCDPEDIVEFLSIPEGWDEGVGLWWRHPREERSERCP
jgi:hypothetical protein